MANYHLEVSIVSRWRGRSVTRLANYITGDRLHDSYADKTYSEGRKDVLFHQIFLPTNAPHSFYNLQHLCDAIEGAEKRYDARTAREFIGSLPNELSVEELVNIVREFIVHNFLEYGLCAVAAIHEGKNKNDPSKNNPHVHIIVPTRTVGSDGFCRKKDREHDRKKYIKIWREQWAQIQNHAYERNGLDVRVSHESLEVQGKHDREPTIHLSRIDYQKEQRGERTPAGDRKRAVRSSNEERVKKHQMEQERQLEMELSR